MGHAFINRFRRTLQQSKLLRPEMRVLVAVSGGSDSVALLSLLHAVAREFKLYLVVAHLDHGLRPESSEDALFVKRLAEELGLPMVSSRINLKDDLLSGGGGLEELARTRRRRFLERAALEHRCECIALAHHQDDQAETFLLNLLRGTGPLGLSGMRPSEPPYVRPLLRFSRNDLRAYLTEQGLDWCEDLSNQDPRYTRNRIRHELLPILTSFNPRISRHLAYLCDRLAADEDCWQDLIENDLQSIIIEDQDGLLLPCEWLKVMPEAFSSRLLRAGLKKVRGDLRRISASHIQAIQDLLSGDRPQSELHLPGAWVGRRYDRLWLRGVAPKSPEWVPVEITGPGRYPLPDGRTVEVTTAPEAQGINSAVAEFPCAKLTFPMIIRTFRPGDRFSPLDMSGTCKLQDFFVDRKLTHEERATQPLIVKDEKVLWVVGLRQCDDLPQNEMSERGVIRLKVQSE